MIDLFCARCGAILVPKKAGRRTVFRCSCGYKEKNRISVVIKEEVKERKRDKIEVVDKKIETLPKTKETCPKCGYEEAYFSILQTRSADESPTRFFKCVKCDHTWRSYQ